MALCDLHYFSPSIRRMTGATIILPEDEQLRGPFPVLYLLHGYSDDHTVWSRRTSIERYAEGLPLIIVMPNGGNGFYVNARQGFAYDTAITSDLIGYIDRMFPTDARRERRVVGGLSMGGYGAIKLALSHPEMFCAAVSHSGALAFAHVLPPEPRPEVFAICGEHPQGGPYDLFALVERADRAQLPALRIDCGVDDVLIEANRAFHAHLDALGIAHEYAEYPGAHTWAYWDEHVQEALAFFTRVLGIERRVQ